MVENGDQNRGSLQRISGDPKGLFGFGGSRAPGAGPERISGDLEGNCGDGEVERCPEMEAGTGGAPIGESRADGQTGGENCPEIWGKGESELGLGSGELGVGEARLDLDAGVREMGEDLVGEGSEGEEAVAGGGSGGGGGGSGGETAEAGEMGRVQTSHPPVDVDHCRRRSSVINVTALSFFRLREEEEGDKRTDFDV